MSNPSNGERWQTTTSARGGYFIEYLSVGGPYRIEVRAIGYEPAGREGMFLALGQRLTVDIMLAPAVVRLGRLPSPADRSSFRPHRPAQVSPIAP